MGNTIIRVLHTPGHTPESIALLVTDLRRGPEPWFVLTGDTIFVGAVGRPDLPGNKERNAALLHASIHEKLLPLPGELEIYPAHFLGSACGAGLRPLAQITLSTGPGRLRGRHSCQSRKGSFDRRPYGLAHAEDGPRRKPLRQALGDERAVLNELLQRPKRQLRVVRGQTDEATFGVPVRQVVPYLAVRRSSLLRHLRLAGVPQGVADGETNQHPSDTLPPDRPTVRRRKGRWVSRRPQQATCDQVPDLEDVVSQSIQGGQTTTPSPSHHIGLHGKVRGRSARTRPGYQPRETGRLVRLQSRCGSAVAARDSRGCAVGLVYPRHAIHLVPCHFVRGRRRAG